MSDIVEILGSKKFSGSTNQTLKSRIILEQPATLRNEYNLFTNVSQDEQFLKEKNENNVYKVYGTISPIISKNFHFRGKKLNVDEKAINFNSDNWSVVLCKPVAFMGSKGKKKYNIPYKDSKGVNTTYKLDLTYGLPATLVHPSPINIKNDGEYFATFLMNYGHNLNIGDQVYINSSDSKVPAGLYFVTGVNKNKITIDLKISPKNLFYIKEAKEASFNLVTKKDGLLQAQPDTKKNEFTGVMKNTQVKNDQDLLISALKADRPPAYDLFESKFSISKVIDNEVMEYYVKQAVVVDVAKGLDACGFSTNLFNQKLYNFFFDKNLDLGTQLDHKNEPITELYVGLIKNGGTLSKKISTVESNFSPLISYTNPGEGIMRISETSNTEISDKPDIGTVYDIGIFEYSSENLTETQISGINHNFILDFVMFNYEPFHEIKIKAKSSYIEDSVSNQYIPKYAVYSRKSDKYIWRDVLDLGVSDDDGNVLDFPFLNGSRYVYTRLIFPVLAEKNKTKKYTFGVNDITNIDSLNNVDNYTRDIITDLFGDETDAIENKEPFKKYTDDKC